MTLKTKIASCLIATLCSGIGTYELIRHGRGSSLNTDDHHSDEDDEHESTDEEADSTSSQKPNEGVDTDSKPPENVPAKEPKDEQTSTQNYFDTDDKPELKLYKDYLIYKKAELINENTNKEVMKNIMLHRLLPHYRMNIRFKKDNMFNGSPEIYFKGETKKSGDKTLYILKKDEDADIAKLKQACAEALNKERPVNKKRDTQVYKLKLWCSTSTIQSILHKYKLRLPTNNEQWKEILNSDWIKEEKYQDKQSFLTKEELVKLKGTEGEDSKIKILKYKCEEVLKKKFVRTNFPATKEFLGGDNKADEFQEAAIFCSAPITAEYYAIKAAAKGGIRKAITEQMKQDYCYIQDKDVDYYKTVKTTDPMEGKSF